MQLELLHRETSLFIFSSTGDSLPALPSKKQITSKNDKLSLSLQFRIAKKQTMDYNLMFTMEKQTPFFQMLPKNVGIKTMWALKIHGKDSRSFPFIILNQVRKGIFSLSLKICKAGQYSCCQAVTGIYPHLFGIGTQAVKGECLSLSSQLHYGSSCLQYSISCSLKCSSNARLAEYSLHYSR